jgi:hypothetical protein
MASALAGVFIVLGLALLVTLWRMGIRRGVRQVVKAFRDHKAVGPKRALTPDELGLMPTGGWIGRNFGIRDYRPQGMRLLIEEKIVLTTDGKKLYMLESALRDSKVRRFAKLD